MRQTILSVLLVLALAFVQAAGLHGHVESRGSQATHGMMDHAPHVHSHWVDFGDADKGHMQAPEIDIVHGGAIRHVPGSSSGLLVAIWACVLLLVWTHVRSFRPRPPLIHSSPPRRAFRPPLRGPPA